MVEVSDLSLSLSLSLGVSLGGKLLRIELGVKGEICLRGVSYF